MSVDEYETSNELAWVEAAFRPAGRVFDKNDGGNTKRFGGCLVLVVSIQLAVRSIGTNLRVEPLRFVFVASRGLSVVTDVPAGRRK